MVSDDFMEIENPEKKRELLEEMNKQHFVNIKDEMKPLFYFNYKSVKDVNESQES